MRPLSRVDLALTCTLSLLGSVHAQSEMERNFIKPPDSAKPRVWWHWLSGNVTKEGITADLEYFSGTATYSRTVRLTDAEAAQNLLLDLGDVREIAEVSVNGAKIDRILWAPPYRMPLGHLLHAGNNTMSVRVTDLWPNRLICDEQPGVTARQTFTGIYAYSKDSPFMPSGMLGPVTLLR